MYYIYELGDDTMKIVKYKKSTKGRYKVITDDGRELLLYEEVILKYDLLIKKEIDDNVLVEMDQYNQEWDVYYTALNMIRNRIRSSYELKELLLRKEYPSDLVLKAISKLEEQGYLNDLGYAKSYVAHYINSNRGPFKIAKELREKHITEENISLALALVFSVEVLRTKDSSIGKTNSLSIELIKLTLIFVFNSPFLGYL